MKKKGVGISGVTGVGKMALAKAFVCEADYELLLFDDDIFRLTRAKFTTSGIVREYERILSQMESAYIGASNRFITNMTPIDVMAELYSTFTWFNEPSESAEQHIDSAWNYACRICSEYLFVIMRIQPENCGARVEHLNALGAGLIHTRLVNDTVNTNMFTVKRKMTDLEKRLRALNHSVFSYYESETPYQNASSCHH